jgi:uncharacterized membrane protein YdjX (TVP38/TMEM64 family)
VSKQQIGSRLSQQVRKYFKIILLISAIVLFFVTPARQLLDRDILSQQLQALGIWTVPAFVVTYILLAVLGLPITVHTLVGGYIFGLVWGTIWSAIAAELGAIGAFYLTRYVFEDWGIANFSEHKILKKFNRAFATYSDDISSPDSEKRSPFNLILALRLVPIAPFNIINFLLALTPVDLKMYSWATFIGIIPGTIAYTWVGAAGKTALQGGERLQLGLAASFLVFLSLLPLFFKRWRF